MYQLLSQEIWEHIMSEAQSTSTSISHNYKMVLKDLPK